MKVLVLVLAMVMAVTPVTALAGTHVTQGGGNGGAPADPDHWGVDGKITTAGGGTDNTWTVGPLQIGDRHVFLTLMDMFLFYAIWSPFGNVLWSPFGK